MKKILMISALVAALALAFVFAGCSSTDPVKHTVTFYNGDAVYTIATVSDGQKVKRPADPERDEYEFDGWYKTSDCDGEKYSFDTPVKSSFSLYAGYKDMYDYETVSSAQEFAAMDRTKAYRLADDIDLTGVAVDTSLPFSGVFDGNGHTISGLKLSAPGGLFGVVTGTVKNLNVLGASIDCDISGGTAYAGIIAERIDGGTVSGCKVMGNITVKNVDMRLSVYAGFIAGRSFDGTIKNCVADGNISVSNMATVYAGGIVGYNGGEGEVRSAVDGCRFGGDITALSQAERGSAYVGGIVGYNAGNISGSLGTGGKLVGTTYHYYDFVGGIAGDNNGGSIKNCLGVHDLKAETWHGSTFTGGVAGHNFLNYTLENCRVWDGQRIELSVTDAEYYLLARHNRVVYDAASALEIASESFQKEMFTSLEIKDGYFPSLAGESAQKIEFTAPKGTRGDPIEIGDATALVDMDLNKSYKLTADITLDGGFAPIGTYEHPFYGSLDGDGHTVKGLALGGDGYLALFGYFGGNVENLNVEASCVSDASGIAYVGAVVAYNIGGRVYGCSAEVDFNVKLDGAHAGAVVAYNDGGTIERCDSSGAIELTAKTPSAYAGGIAATNYGGKITYCTSATALTVAGKTTLSAGGAVGKNEGDIAYCLNIGNISATLETDNQTSTAALGGIVGTHASGKVIGCFAVDGIKGSAMYSVFVSGGIAGINRAEIDECVYLCDDVSYGAGYSKDEISVTRATELSELKDIIAGMDGDVWTFDETTELPALKGRGK